MNHKKIGYLSLVVVVGLLFLWGCPKKTEINSSADEHNEIAAVTPTTPEPASSVKADDSSKNLTDGGDLKPAYFDFDRSNIREDARESMHANTEWLKAHPQAKVKIVGNCDERGTVGYNHALGEKRAISMKEYLVKEGISAGRISVVSNGKENPVCTESNEMCWQKNRRGDFAIALI